MYRRNVEAVTTGTLVPIIAVVLVAAGLLFAADVGAIAQQHPADDPDTSAENDATAPYLLGLGIAQDGGAPQTGSKTIRAGTTRVTNVTPPVSPSSIP